MKKVQFFESYEKVQKCWILRMNHIFQKGSILNVIFVYEKKKGSILLSHIWQKMVQFCESCFKRVQFFKSYWKKDANSVSHLFKKGSFLWLIFQKGYSVLWVILTKIQLCESYWKRFIKRGSTLWVIFEKGFYSLRYTQKGSIHWFFFVFLTRKTVQVFESKKEQFILWVIYFVKLKYSLSHTKKWIQFLWVMLKRFQFLWVMLKRRVRSCWKEGFNSVSHVLNKRSINWVTFFEKCSILWSVSEKCAILWVVSEKCAILWLICFQKFNSSSHMFKKVNSLSHFF